MNRQTYEHTRHKSVDHLGKSINTKSVVNNRSNCLLIGIGIGIGRYFQYLRTPVRHELL